MGSGGERQGGGGVTAQARVGVGRAHRPSLGARRGQGLAGRTERTTHWSVM